MAESRNRQLLNIAVDIFREFSPRKPLHVDEIAAIAISSNRNLGMSSEEFKNRVNQALLSHVNSKAKGTLLITRNREEGKIKGYYKLTEKGRLPQPPVTTQEIKEVSDNFAGTGGEFAVAAQLCFAGYNVSKPAIDVGIDWLAEKEGSFFNIQVKTSSTPQKTNGQQTFNFQIKEKIFQRHISNTWYVFVMRFSQIDMAFAVIPGSVLNNWRRENRIRGKDILSIQITSDKNKKTFSLLGANLNHLMNNFNDIR